MQRMFSRFFFQRWRHFNDKFWARNCNHQLQVLGDLSFTEWIVPKFSYGKNCIELTFSQKGDSRHVLFLVCLSYVSCPKPIFMFNFQLFPSIVNNRNAKFFHWWSHITSHVLFHWIDGNVSYKIVYVSDDCLNLKEPRQTQILAWEGLNILLAQAIG